MNWPHFILYLAGIYLLYYPAMILYDFSRSKSSKSPEVSELTFNEDVLPKSISHLPDKEEAPPLPAKTSKPDSAVIASGGVSLKDLFNLCREEAIIYTRPVSFQQ